jgi:sugar O-acyltransferase (sialic acid O-acetyltransferase NeuD family)
MRVSEQLVVVGAGGFGRETLDVVEAINGAGAAPRFDLVGVIDDRPSDENLSRLEMRSISYLGTVEDSLPLLQVVSYVIAIGSPQARAEVAERLGASSARPATLVHPQASVGSMGTLGDGAVICAGVRISTNVTIGRHVHLNANATIGHDTVLGDFVSLNPMAAVSGDCVVGKGVLVGVGGVVLNGLSIGEWVIVGGSACVVGDVPAGVVAKGVPARWPR